MEVVDFRPPKNFSGGNFSDLIKASDMDSRQFFPRPRGRSRKGHYWDSRKGAWVRDTTSNCYTNTSSRMPIQKHYSIVHLHSFAINLLKITKRTRTVLREHPLLVIECIQTHIVIIMRMAIIRKINSSCISFKDKERQRVRVIINKNIKESKLRH